MNDPEIHIISEPKAFPLTPSAFRGSMGSVVIQVCTTCSALVHNAFDHYRWHESLTKETPNGENT